MDFMIEELDVAALLIASIEIRPDPWATGATDMTLPAVDHAALGLDLGIAFVPPTPHEPAPMAGFPDDAFVFEPLGSARREASDGDGLTDPLGVAVAEIAWKHVEDSAEAEDAWREPA